MRRHHAPIGILFLLPALASALEDPFDATLDGTHWQSSVPLNGSKVSCPLEDSLATDGTVLELVYPGPTSPRKYGPRWSTALETVDRRGFGSYEARLKPAAARSSEGVVSAFFTYFNDGTDYDGDGIADNSEIDFEFLAAEPSILYLTVWTDYENVDGLERFYHTARRIDLRTGQVWETELGYEGEYGHLEEIAPLEWSVPGFTASDAYRTYGFDWQANQVVFWMDAEDGSGPHILWDLQGAPDLQIPTVEAFAMINLWHNQYHWHTGKPALPPSQPASHRVDRVSVP